jgi:hypothetical protein
MVEPRLVTLSNLADGAADELWRAALARVLENIEDPNTYHKAKRRITLTFDFVADEERRVGDVTINSVVRLASVKPLTANVYFGRHQGHLVAVEAPRQEDLFTAPAPTLAAVEGGGRP